MLLGVTRAPLAVVLKANTAKSPGKYRAPPSMDIPNSVAAVADLVGHANGTAATNSIPMRTNDK